MLTGVVILIRPPMLGLSAPPVQSSLLGLADPNCTVERICIAGYAKTVRPPASYTNKLKIQQMKALRLSGDPSQFEEDHVIPLELCGDPRDPRNLNPQPWPKARIKDVMETRFHKAVCAGQMPLKEAQRKIVIYE